MSTRTWRDEENSTVGDKAKRILESVGAFYKDDHIVLTSGLHAAVYVNHDPLFLNHHTPQLSDLAGLLAQTIIEVIRPSPIPGALVGPQTGGWHLAHWTGYHYRIIKDAARSVPAEKDGNDGFFIDPRDQSIVAGKSVLLIDDVLTTGKSAIAAQKAVEAIGGTVMGLLVVCDRSGKTAEELGIKAVWSLFQLFAQKWDAETCPMCKAGQAINQKVGHPEKFIAKVAE